MTNPERDWLGRTWDRGCDRAMWLADDARARLAWGRDWLAGTVAAGLEGWQAWLAGWAAALGLWLESRRYGRLLWGAPLVLAALAAAVLAVRAARDGDRVLIARYRVETKAALDRRDYPVAQTCLERLLALGDDPPGNTHHLTLVAEARGRQDYAAVLWDRLTPTDGSGHPAAYLDQARRRLAEAWPKPGQTAVVELLLRRACEAAAVPPTNGKDDTHDRQRVELIAQTLLGELALLDGRPADAERYFIRAVELETPVDVSRAPLGSRQAVNRATRARAGLGKIFTEAGHYERAENHLLLAAVALQPRDPQWSEVHGLLGRGYVRTNLFLQAKPHLIKAAAQGVSFPGQVEVHTRLAQVWLHDGNVREAEVHLRRAVSPSLPRTAVTPEARMLLGRILVESRREGEAEAHLREALRDAADPVVGVEVRVLLGRLCLKSKRSPEAEQLLEQAADARLADHPAVAEARVLLGQLYQAAGRLAEAEPHLRATADDRPEVGLALGRLLVARGEEAEALVYVRRAASSLASRVDRSPLDLEARRQWAEALMAEGRYAAAAAALDDGLRAARVTAALTPGAGLAGLLGRATREDALTRHTPAHVAAAAGVYRAWLAVEERDDGPKPAERLELFERLLLADPAGPDVLTWLLGQARTPARPAELKDETCPVLGRLLLAFDALAGGREDETRAPLDDALGRGPAVAEALNNLARALTAVDRDHAARAAALMNAVLARFPDRPAFRETRGHALAKLERWAEARADLEAAIPGLTDPRASQQLLKEVLRRSG
jgi:tetratricopeptide (TPR) repeat protein